MGVLFLAEGAAALIAARKRYAWHSWHHFAFFPIHLGIVRPPGNPPRKLSRGNRPGNWRFSSGIQSAREAVGGIIRVRAGLYTLYTGRRVVVVGDFGEL